MRKVIYAALVAATLIAVSGPSMAGVIWDDCDCVNKLTE